MESPDIEGSIPFLDTKCIPNSNHTIQTTVYRKPTDTDSYLDWNSSHPVSAKRVIQALTHRAKTVSSTQLLLAREMDYFCTGTVTLTGPWKKTIMGLGEIKFLLRKQPRKPLSHLHISKEWAKSLEEYSRSVRSKKSLKGCNTLETLLMHPMDLPWGKLNSCDIGECSRCLARSVKEHNTSSTSALYHTI